MRTIISIAVLLTLSACSSAVLVKKCKHQGSDIWQCEEL